MSVLTDDECSSLTDASLRFLEEIGVLVTHAEAADLLKGAGGKQGDDGRARIDGALVRELVQRAPGSFKLYDRSGEVWYPTLLDRTSVGAQREDLYGRAHAKVEDLLAAHEPRVDDAVRRELESYAESPEQTVHLHNR